MPEHHRSSERRTVRPYLGLDPIQELFDGIKLEYGPTQVPNGGSRQISESDYLQTNVQLHFGEDDPERFAFYLGSRISEAELDPDAVEVIVVASTPYLKLSEILWQGSVDELRRHGARLTLATQERRADPFRTPFGGCRVGCYAVLRQDLKKRPLKPHRKGTWLSRAEFLVGTDSGEIGLQVEPLTPAIRESKRLADETIRFVELADPTVEGGESDVTVYVDEPLLNLVHAHQGAPGSRSFMHQIFLDVVNVIVAQSARILAKSNQDLAAIEGTLCDKLIDLVGRKDNRRPDSDRKAFLFKRLKTDPAWFMAQAHCCVQGLHKDLEKSILGGN